MEHSQNAAPRKISDTTEAVCSKCGEVCYSETLIGTLQDDGSYEYSRLVVGSFTQVTDSVGNPTGPVIPTCTCKE